MEKIASLLITSYFPSLKIKGIRNVMM